MGSEAERGAASSPTPTPPWPCCGLNCSPETWCWSRPPTRRDLARWPIRWPRTAGAIPDDRHPARRRDLADGVDPADPDADPAVQPAGLRPRDPRGRPAEPQDQARHAVDGWGGHPGRHLGGLPRHPPGRPGVQRQRPVGLGSAGAVPGHHARCRRIRRRPDQDPAITQSGAEQDRQDRRPDHRRRPGRHPGPAVPQ